MNTRVKITGLQFTLQVKGLPPQTFSVLDYTLEEALSEPYLLKANLVSKADDIEPEQVVEKGVLLQVWLDGQLQNQYHAHVYNFIAGDVSEEHAYYYLEAGPALTRLSWRQNSRIFQEKNVQEIVTTLLSERKVTQFKFDLKDPDPAREFCVQYQESDLDFIERLLAEIGACYYFEHSNDQHTLMIVDDKNFHPVAGNIPFNNQSGGLGELIPGGFGARERFIYELQAGAKVAQSRAQLKDYNFKVPAYHYRAEHQGTNLDAQADDYEYFDYPGRYKNGAIAKRFANYRLDALRSESQSGEGKANSALIQAGYCFRLQEHRRKSFNRLWLVTRVTHIGKQPQALEEKGAPGGSTSYHNEFDVVPSDLQWRPPNMKKPQIDGLHTAIVVGPPGEEIHCDKYGRVKLQFPWDRYGQSNDQSSCWVRSSQGWGGGRYGIMNLPRVGHEVLVSYLNSDPDQPIIIGRTYNDANMPPYDLPTHKTRSTWKSDSHKAPGSNEIRYEDRGGEEEIYIHAQKDQNNVVENNETTRVGVDRTEQVGNNETIRVGHDTRYEVANDVFYNIGRNQQETYGKDHIQRVGNIHKQNIHADHIETIGRNYQGQISGQLKLNVGTKITTNAGQVHQLMAGEKFEIAGPGGKIAIDSSGITLSAAVINIEGDINMGGSGSAQVPALNLTLNEDLPICSECRKKKEGK